MIFMMNFPRPQNNIHHPRLKSPPFKFSDLLDYKAQLITIRKLYICHFPLLMVEIEMPPGLVPFTSCNQSP